MAAKKSLNKNSAFAEHGLAETIKKLCAEIRSLYLGDEIPWVIGYSGGKDSSAILQLIWMAIKEIDPAERRKKIHVISTDTLVEQPMVAAWVDTSHARMRKSAEQQQMPIEPHKLIPDVKDTFWVNLIGKGYPAPRKLFRWCTSRMKINPSNNFIRNVVRDNGEAILVLGTRRAESARRSENMTQRRKIDHQNVAVRDRLAPNDNLPNSMVYTPIEDWTNDDVWLFLMQVKNPWGHTNKSLLGMYQGASADGECPLVVDSSTPSCGSSRFGCWVCTVVDKDRSMEAMIKNDEEKVWMKPLLDLRNDLGDFSKDKSRRDYRRMSGKVQLFHDGLVRGPYRKKAREHWLRRVLAAQKEIRSVGPDDFKQIELISHAELHEIRRLWLHEKHEFDDPLPVIYEQELGEPFPMPAADDRLLGVDEWELLKQVCGENEEAFFELQASLLDVERAFRGMSRRAGIYDALLERIKACQFENENEALLIRQDQERRLQEVSGETNEPDEKVRQGHLFNAGAVEKG